MEIAIYINGKAHFPTLQCIGWADVFAQPVEKQALKMQRYNMSDEWYFVVFNPRSTMIDG